MEPVLTVEEWRLDVGTLRVLAEESRKYHSGEDKTLVAPVLPQIFSDIADRIEAAGLTRQP